MQLPNLTKILILITPVLLAFTRPAFADTVTLKDGSVIHGKNLQVAGGIIT